METTLCHVVRVGSRFEESLEKKGIKVSRRKTDYMRVNEREVGETAKMQGAEGVKVDEVKYLGSTSQSNGWCTGEVKKSVGGDECLG